MHAFEQIPQLPSPAEKHSQRYLIDSLMAAGGELVVTGIIYSYAQKMLKKIHETLKKYSRIVTG